MEAVTNFINSLSIGTAQNCGSLTLYPVISGFVSKLEYLILDEALSQGGLKISEIDASGSVPELRVMNDLDKRVFMADGEELVGAKQNRILNTSILLEAKSKLLIPVSCVEAGRWESQGMHFHTTDHYAHTKLRKKRAAAVNFSLIHGRGFQSDQGEVWNEVSEKLHTFAADNPTSALDEAYEKLRKELNDFVEKLQPVEGQLGVVAVIGDAIGCADIFDQAGTLKKLLPKLVRSYALDAMEKTGKHEKLPDDGQVLEFLKQTLQAECRTQPSVGLGTDSRFSSANLQGAALVVEDTVLHLNLFPTDPQQEGRNHRRGSRMARPSRRRWI